MLNKKGNSYGNVYPQWAPDGKLISYGEMVDGVVQVGVIGADGTGAKVITKAMHRFTRGSPDGKSLSYCRLEVGGSACRKFNRQLERVRAGYKTELRDVIPNRVEG